MTVLRGELAIKQSKALIRMFKQIYKSAKKNIYVVDNYIGLKTL